MIEEASLSDWRQFSCITCEESPAFQESLSPLHRNCSCCVFILLPYSCALVSSVQKDPFAEYIKGEIVSTYDGNCCNGRSPRKLHIQIQKDGQMAWCELCMADRTFFDKAVLGSNGVTPSKKYFIPHEQQEQLKRWLSNWYTAFTFPDNFNSRLKNVSSNIKKALQSADCDSSNITSLLIHVDPEDAECSPDEPYEITLAILCKSEAFKKTERAENLRKTIQGCIKGLSQSEVSLVGDVQLISEERISISQYREFKQLNSLDDLSEKAGGTSSFPVK